MSELISLDSNILVYGLISSDIDQNGPSCKKILENIIAMTGGFRYMIAAPVIAEVLSSQKDTTIREELIDALENNEMTKEFNTVAAYLAGQIRRTWQKHIGATKNNDKDWVSIDIMIAASSYLEGASYICTCDSRFHDIYNAMTQIKDLKKTIPQPITPQELVKQLKIPPKQSAPPEASRHTQGALFFQPQDIED